MERFFVLRRQLAALGRLALSPLIGFEFC